MGIPSFPGHAGFCWGLPAPCSTSKMHVVLQGSGGEAWTKIVRGPVLLVTEGAHSVHNRVVESRVAKSKFYEFCRSQFF